MRLLERIKPHSSAVAITYFKWRTFYFMTVSSYPKRRLIWAATDGPVNKSINAPVTGVWGSALSEVQGQSP